MLLGYIWLLGTFVSSSCDIKINIKIVQLCCRNLEVRGLREIYLIGIYITQVEQALIFLATLTGTEIDGLQCFSMHVCIY